MLINDLHLTEINSPKQTIQARVELYKGSALERICTCSDVLSQFTVERAGENKFFGYGICQNLNIKLIDINREINLTKENTVEAAFGVKGNVVYPFPVFYIDSIERDETTNELSIVAYDAVYKATQHTVSELNIQSHYSIREFAAACATLLGLPFRIENVNDGSFDTEYTAGANFDGTETIRSALNAIAEATQTIYFINHDWELTFKRLDKEGDALATINKNQYFELKNDGVVILGSVIHTTELDDTVIAAAASEGEKQFIRDNPFWELREDISTLVDNAQAAAGGLSINAIDCNWIGNYLLEIGDKINFVAEDNSNITTYLLQDVITFDGTFEQHTQWKYDSNDNETTNNPTSLGDALNKTFARVDKINKEIQLVASDVSANDSAISVLQINTNSIDAFVKKVEETNQSSIDSINKNLETLSKQVSLKMSAEDVRLTVESELTSGIDKVRTTTGFTFDNNGLSINKSDSDISTTISEDGMKIERNNTEVLRADNQGVKAEDLHATTYLIIGDNSRFEDQGNRTACFWMSD